MTFIPPRKAAAVVIIAFWFVMMTLLFERHYGGRHPRSQAAGGPLPQDVYGERWFGIHQKEKRIGYSVWKFDRLNGGYRASEKLKLRLMIMDTEKDVEVTTDARLGPDLGLKSFDLRLASDLDLHVIGTVQDRDLAIVIESAGTRTERTIRLRERPILNLSMVPSVMKEGLKPGSRFDLSVLDPVTLGLDPVTVIVEGSERIAAMGGVRDVIRLRGDLGGVDFSIWLTEKGEVIKQETPLGFTLMRETKEEALRTVRPSLDMTEAASVPFNLKLPEGISYLKARISGIDAGGLDMDGGRQTLHGDVVEITKEKLSAGTGSGTARTSAEYLADSIFIQPGNSRIKTLSGEITKGEKDSLKRVSLINRWVYRNIKKFPLVSMPLSPAVLATGKGDCNEHAVLFASLARAAGLPARISLGLVYDAGRFYYHAWDEVFIEEWIAVDPTLGQFPADAAHLRLLAGDLDKQTRIVSLLGKIKLEGLDFRP